MNRSYARNGLTLLEVLVVIGIFGLLLTISLPAIQRVRDAGARIQCLNKLKQIGIALQHYHDHHKVFPAGCSFQNGKDPHPFMSWCTRVLPYLEQQALWDEAQAAFAKEPSFLKRPPHVGDRPQPLFLCPSDAREVFSNRLGNLAGYTFYLGVEGTNQNTKDGVLFLDSRVRTSEITDGLSNTLFVGERPPSATGSLGWWYAGWGQNRNGSAEMILGTREIAEYPSLIGCPTDSNRYRQGRHDLECDALHFWSLHFGGAHFLMCDGSARRLDYSANAILPALATRAGNEAVELP